MTSTDPVLFPVLLDASTDPLLKAVAAYLARYRGQTRVHTESDLRAYLVWCRERGVEPLSASRAQIELYVRWMQEIRHLQPSTVSRRVSVMAGFYRTCVIDQVILASPADYVRRPNVPPESPTLGLSHLEFEAMLAASRASGNVYDFALVAMLGLLGLRIFEACGANIADLGEEHGHRVLKVHGKGGKIVLTPLPPAVQRAIERAIEGRAEGPILLNLRGTRMDRHAATRRLKHLADHAGVTVARMHPHMLRHTFAPPCSTPAWISVTYRSPHVTPTREPRCATTGHARTSTGTRTTSSPPTWPPAPDTGAHPAYCACSTLDVWVRTSTGATAATTSPSTD